MYVHIGNSSAIEGFRDETSDQPELVRYKPAEGERVTEMIFPDEMSVSEAFQTTLAVLKHHMAEGTTPDWVESDSDGLTALLQEEWGLNKSATSRPKSWGKDTGADEFASSGATAEEN